MTGVIAHRLVQSRGDWLVTSWGRYYRSLQDSTHVGMEHVHMPEGKHNIW